MMEMLRSSDWWTFKWFFIQKNIMLKQGNVCNSSLGLFHYSWSQKCSLNISVTFLWDSRKSGSRLQASVVNYKGVQDLPRLGGIQTAGTGLFFPFPPIKYWWTSSVKMKIEFFLKLKIRPKQINKGDINTTAISVTVFRGQYLTWSVASVW